MKNYHALSLFSGGLDSILSARLVMEQGLNVKCLHFFSPFFGHPKKIDYWRRIYQLDIDAVDVGQETVDMLVQRPKHGFGSAMNPCIDCKILMISTAKKLMEKYGAQFLISGEVLGQRPMSQRRDTMHAILNEADVNDILLRPLCAKHMPETIPEQQGLIDRSLLKNITGRGRKDQFDLAAHFNITEIPSPGGGCKLTEKENTSRFLPILLNFPSPTVNDFKLADVGRQYWYDNCLLSIGRQKFDNEIYPELIQETDYYFKVDYYPGPIALGRGASWSPELIQKAASLVASYSPKASKAAENGQTIKVRIIHNASVEYITVVPSRETIFQNPTWEDSRQTLQEMRKSYLNNTERSDKE